MEIFCDTDPIKIKVSYVVAIMNFTATFLLFLEIQLIN
jgi:hypothetical protein